MPVEEPNATQPMSYGAVAFSNYVAQIKQLRPELAHQDVVIGAAACAAAELLVVLAAQKFSVSHPFDPRLLQTPFRG